MFSSSDQAVHDERPLLHVEDEGSAIFRNVGNYLTNDIEPRPSRI
jgi:hypothetical protein